MTKRPVLRVAIPLLALACLARGQQKDDYSVSPMRVQEMKPIHFFHATMETTMGDMGKTLQKPLGEILAIHPGQPIVISRGASAALDQPVLVEIGVDVPASTASAGQYTVKALPKFRCASVLFSGPVKLIGKAYAQVYRDLYTAGLQPTGESRQMFLYWEGADSLNNVAMVQIGVKE